MSKSSRIDHIGTGKVGPRSETGRFEAPIHPYHYPEELGANPDFDVTSDYRDLAPNPLPDAKNDCFSYNIHVLVITKHGSRPLDSSAPTPRAIWYRSREVTRGDRGPFITRHRAFYIVSPARNLYWS